MGIGVQCTAQRADDRGRNAPPTLRLALASRPARARAPARDADGDPRRGPTGLRLGRRGRWGLTAARTLSRFARATSARSRRSSLKLLSSPFLTACFVTRPHLLRLPGAMISLAHYTSYRPDDSSIFPALSSSLSDFVLWRYSGNVFSYSRMASAASLSRPASSSDRASIYKIFTASA